MFSGSLLREKAVLLETLQTEKVSSVHGGGVVLGSAHESW